MTNFHEYTHNFINEANQIVDYNEIHFGDKNYTQINATYALTYLYSKIASHKITIASRLKELMVEFENTQNQRKSKIFFLFFF